MKQRFINATHVEGYLYEHDLTEKVSGENSKNPGTPFITGTISIATDNAMTNIVSMHVTYVAPTYPGKDGKPGKPNANYPILKQIVDGEIACVTKDGPEKAAKVRMDASIGLNDFYTDRNGEVELISAKRNEGGFIHLASTLNEDEKLRNTFDVDMIITNVRHIDEDVDRKLPEKAIIRGCIFDFSKAMLPVEFSAVNPHAISYFEGLEASSKNPVFTHIKGRQVSETIVRQITEESAFGDPSVREVTSSRKDWVITWAQPAPYDWNTEETITEEELATAVSNREIYLAGVKQRWQEYRSSNSGAKSAPTAKGAFNF